MKEEKNDRIVEKSITKEEISRIDPNTIYKIILLDGSILIVQNNNSSIMGKNKNIISKNKNDIGATNNLKFNQIPNSNKKNKNSFSYVEWDFPNTKNRAFQRNLEEELLVSKTNDDEKEKNENNDIRDISRDSAINRNIKSKNYSFYESKHISNKKIINNNISDIESKNSSCFIKNDDNYNYKEINKDKNKKIKEEEKKDDDINLNNKINNNNNIQSNTNKIEIININNNIEKNNKEKKDEFNNINNNTNNNINININVNNDNNKNKDNLSFGEKIKLIKYGLLDYDNELNSNGLKSDDNNIQKINKIMPLNIIIDKNKNKNQEDINKQFNKLLNKFNESKNSSKKVCEDNSYLTYKTYGKENSSSCLNDDINRLNNFIHKNKFNSNYNNMNMTNKIENNKGNSYRDLNERICQLRKKTMSNNYINFIPGKNANGQRQKLLVLPSNFK